MKIHSFKCCIDCQKRKVGCHSTCEDYITTKELRQKEKEAEIKKSMYDANYVAYAQQNMIKNRRRREKYGK